MHSTKKYLPLTLTLVLIVGVAALAGYMGTRTYLVSDTLTGTADVLSYDEITMKIADIKNRMPWAEEQITRAQEDIQTIEGYIAQEQSSMETYRASAVSTQKQIDALTTSIASLDALIKTQTAQLATLTQQITKATGAKKTQLTNQKKTLEAKNTKDKQTQKTQTSKKNSLQDTLISAKKEVKYLENNISGRTQEKETQVQNLQKLESDLQALKDELASLEDQLTRACPDPTQVWDTATGTCITDESVDTGGDDAFDELDDSIPDYIIPAIPVTGDIFDQYTFSYDSLEDEAMFHTQISDALRDLRANPGTTLDLSFMPDDQVSEQEKADFPIKYERDGVVYRLTAVYRSTVISGIDNGSNLTSSILTERSDSAKDDLEKTRYEKGKKLFDQAVKNNLGICGALSWFNLLRKSGCYYKGGAGTGMTDKEKEEQASQVVGKFLYDATESDTYTGISNAELARGMNKNGFSGCEVLKGVKGVQELCDNPRKYNSKYCVLGLSTIVKSNKGHFEDIIAIKNNIFGSCKLITNDVFDSESGKMHTWGQKGLIKPKNQFMESYYPTAAVCCESACSGDTKSMQK